LQLYTRRLHEWRLADGTEGYWAGLLGTSRLASPAATSIDFVRSISPV
jgi:acyl-CoA dehydrogenase